MRLCRGLAHESQLWSELSSIADWLPGFLLADAFSPSPRPVHQEATRSSRELS